MPKGVTVPHRGIVRLVVNADVYPFAPGTRVLFAAPVSFDASTLEIWGALLSGGTLVTVPPGEGGDLDRTAAMIERHGIDMAFFTTGLFEGLRAAHFQRLAGLRSLIFGGDRITPAVLARVRRGLPGVRLVNAYGPTENTTISTIHMVGEAVDPSQPVPIGRPIAQTDVHVLASDGSAAPVGVVGEIALGGDGLALGYWRRPDATAERFVTHKGERLYLSGDLGRWRADGTLEFRGRADDQVKVRGFRIEPGEVEAALAHHPSVSRASVLVRGGRAGTKRLVAAVVPAGDPPAPGDLAAHLAGRLPPAMVPAEFIVLDSLPLAATGKIDRAALAAMPGREATAAPPPSDAGAVVTVVQILAEVLEVPVERVTPDADFFALGGHSLLALELTARVCEAFGATVELRDVLAEPTARAIAALLSQPIVDAAEATRPAVARPGFAQERLWFIDQVEPGGSRYNVPAALELNGPLDIDALRQAIAGLFVRHDALRTRFVADDGGQPLAVVDPASAEVPPLPMHDLSARVDADGDARRLAAAEGRRPFALDRDPMLRASLIRIATERHVLLLVLHHIAVDGWSLGILVGELDALYRAARDGQPHALPPALQPGPAAAAERAFMETEACRVEEAWWRERLSGAPASHGLILDKARPATSQGRGGHVDVPLPADMAARLAAFARAEGATGFAVILAAAFAALHRWSGEADIVIGSPVAGRSRREDFGVVGLLLNTLALREHVDGEETFRALLARVRRGTVDALGHARLPFERVVELSGVPRLPGANPLFQVMLSYENTPKPATAPGGLSPGRFDIPYEDCKFDLTFDIEAVGEHFHARIEYDAALFTREAAVRFANQFGRLVDAALTAPDTPVNALPLDPPHTAALRAASATGPQVSVPHATIVDALDALDARADGSVPALLGREPMDWTALAARSGALAGALAERGVGRGDLVGIALERSAASVIALLAVWRAGATAVPLDPAAPVERLRILCADAGLAHVIAGPPGAARLLEAGLDPAALVAPDAAAPEPGEAAPSPDDPAYVIYTSGSSGAPKGVVVPHAALANLCAAVVIRDGLTAADRVLHFASPLFDVAIEEIAPTLACGAAVVPWLDNAAALDPAAFAAFVSAHAITVLNLPTAYWHTLVEAGLVLPACVRLLVVGGEAPAAEAVRSWRAAHPDVTLVNAYGPTEACVTATAFTLAPGETLPADAATVPIGRPLANVTAHVLDTAMRPVADGVPGELWIGGRGVATGYLGRPDLTGAAFRPDPFAPGGRIYRTGDRARWTAAGELEFLGRRDHQIKLRGYRIELAEVEAPLREHPAVGEAVATLHRRGAAGEGDLVAWYTDAEGVAPASADTLRRHLAARLPAHALPTRMVRLDAMPRTAGGKADRSALAARPLPADAAAAPLTPEEAPLAALWAELLGRPSVGPDDDFIALGGHSLLAVRLAHRLGEHLGRKVPVAMVLRHPTVRSLAAALADAPVPNALQVLERRGRGVPLVLAPGGDGHAASYLALAAALGRTRAVFGYDLPGLAGDEAPLSDIPAIAARMARALAREGLDPAGVCLAGWSFGAAVALELAHQLTAAGTPPRGLLLLDGFLAGSVPAAGAAAALDRLSATPPAVLAANEMALGAYRPAFRLALDVHAIEPAITPPGIDRSAVRAAWQDCLARPLRVTTTPGDHFSMLKPPHVARLANQLGDLVDGLGAPATAREPVAAK